MLSIKNEKGIALVLATLLLAVLSVLAIAMVFLGRYETRFLVKERLSDSALYIADGGVEFAINELLRNDPDFRGPETHSIGNAGEFTVSVSIDGQPADHFEITSIGFVPDAANPQETRTVRSVVDLTEEISPVFEYAVASQGNITLQGNVVVNSDDPAGEGDIYSGGDILLQDNATINGDASAAGSITIEGGNITGEQKEGAETLDFPEVDTARYVSEAQAGGTYIGEYKVKSDQNLGPLYIDGDLVISGNYQVTLTGTVFVTGSVKLSGTPDNYSITGAETLVANYDITMMGSACSGIPLVISAHGNVTLGGTISVQGSVIYAPEGNVTIKGHPDVTGVVVGQTVTVEGSATVTRQVDLTGYPLPGSGAGTVTVVSWQEL